MIPLGIVAAATARGPAAWRPANLSAPPKIWLNENSPITAVSGSCSQWNDLSASGFHFTQSVSGRRPQIIGTGLNGRRTIRFDGSDDFLSCSVSGIRDLMRNVQAGYFMAVIKKSALDGTGIDRTLFRLDTALGAARFAAQIGSSLAGANTAELGVRRLDGDLFAWLGGGASVGTDFHVMMFAMDWAGRTGRIYMDGALAGLDATLSASAGATSNTASDANPALAAGDDLGTGYRCLDCEIAEVVAGSGSALPSEEEIDKLFGYAAHRWGLAANLPVDHPYKDAPPTL